MGWFSGAKGPTPAEVDAALAAQKQRRADVQYAADAQDAAARPKRWDDAVERSVRDAMSVYRAENTWRR